MIGVAAHIWGIGKPLTEMQPMSSKSILPPALPTNISEAVQVRPEPKNTPQSCCNSPAAISFVRNRMFYARAALNAKGRVRFGLRHIRRSAQVESEPRMANAAQMP